MARRIFRKYRSKTKIKAMAILAAFVAPALASIVLLEYRVATPDGSLRKKFTDIFKICVIADSYKESHCTFDDCGRSPQSVIYVLGGTRDSLVLKFRTAIGLCGSETANKIMLLSTPGITEFDEVLGRNLTNDEWALKELYGLDKADREIELIRVQEYFFGTLSEAVAVKAAVSSIGIRCLTLVCSAYHSRRVQVTFSNIFQGTETNIRIKTVDEEIGLIELLTEFVKLIAYESIVLPLKIGVR